MRAKPRREDNHAKEQVIKEAVKMARVPLNFQIPEELHTNFKAKTASEKKKMREVLEQIIREYTYNK